MTPLVVSPFHPVARLTEPEEPGRELGAGKQEAALEHFLWEMGLDHLREEIRVNHHTALTYSAFWACVRIISCTIASLGWHQFERSADAKSKLPVDDDLSWTINVQANPEMSAYEWRQVALKDALTWGNHYSEIESTRFGRLVSLWRLSPDLVAPERTDGGRLVYTVYKENGAVDAVLDASQVFHLRGLGPDGLVGYSVVEMARRYIEMGLSHGTFGQTWLRNGPTLGGILEMPGHVKKEEREETRRTLQANYGGSKNAGKFLVVSGGVKFTPLGSIPNTDSQFIESGAATVLDICRFFGVPPHLVAELSRATFSNIEHQAIEFVQSCLLPWCRRLEAEAQVKFYPRQSRRYTRINLNALLRGDSKTQVENVVKQVQSGLLMLDEGRELFDYNPLPDGLGKTPLVQGAMVPLEVALDPPEPAAAAPSAPAREEEGEVSNSVAAAFGGLLEKAYARLQVNDVRLVRNANKTGRLASHVRDHYGPEGEKRIAEQLLPIFQALSAVMGKSESAEAWAAAAAERYAGRARHSLDCLEEADAPRRWADEEIGLLGATLLGVPAARPVIVENRISLADLPAPVVNNVVNVPPAPEPRARSIKKIVGRDKDGRIESVVEEEVPC